MQGDEMNNIKKFIIIIAVSVLVIALAAGCGNNRPPTPIDDSKAEETIPESQKPSMPFKDLDMFDVDHITVEFGIHSYRLSDQECGKFVGLLNDIVIYGNATEMLDGGCVTVKIAYRDNREEVKVDLCDRQVYIDGIGYECERELCRAASDYIYDIYLYQFYN